MALAMPRPIPAEELEQIERTVRAHPGITSAEIADALGVQVPRRTLQFRLKRLVDEGRVLREGEGRWTRYSAPGAAPPIGQPESVADEAVVPLSPDSKGIRAYLRQPLAARKPVGYNRAFLNAYRPGETFYLPEEARARLAGIGAGPVSGQEPAGTYARQILNRLLIDLSWNSSRLEGNTYSLLDTKRLIEFGQEAEGRDRLEAQMILNHKDAVEFLVGNAAEIGFNRYTILNLHAILANNLLADARAAGRLRHIGVGIDGSVYHPPETPQLVEECFDQLLATAVAIADPFEQSIFVMVQLPYLQPFDDVNKRVSRMAANIPFIKTNLSPLSFTDLPRNVYAHAILGVYELNRIEMLRDVFIWSYERSAQRYAAVRQSLGEPDPFRLRHRDALRAVIAEVVQGRMDRRTAAAHITSWATAHLEENDQAQFREVAETELLGLHEGNFARYPIRPGEFAAWQEIWGPRVT
jgi:DNA-binding transcriptional ArsR family regulator